MVEYTKDDHLDLIFHALADRTRRQLLNQVQKQSLCVTDMAANYDMSLNAVSKHIKVLEKAGLIERQVDGRIHYCQANPKELQKAEAWIKKYKKFWTAKLDNLEKFVTQRKSKEKK